MASRHKTFSRIMARKTIWHHGIAVDPSLLGNVTQVVTVWIDNRFENIAASLLSWMLGDPHFSFRRSLPFLILSILTKKKQKSGLEKLQIFRLLCSRATEVFFLRLICIVFQGLFHLRKRYQLQKFILVILVMLNWVRLPDLKITNMAYFIADWCTLRSS